jgi:hypothetical protein
MDQKSCQVRFPWRSVTSLACLCLIGIRRGPVGVDQYHTLRSYILTVVLLAGALGLGVSAVRSKLRWDWILGVVSLVAGLALCAGMVQDTCSILTRP